MKKDNFNSKLRSYARTLSPSSHEMGMVTLIYESFNDLLGVNDCIQIGSYPRLTAITPIHDLDILYVLGVWNEANHSPEAVLLDLFNQINSDYVNPTSYAATASLQTHSVIVEFTQESRVVFSVDIVPAYSHGKNNFRQDTYKVPEVIKEKNHLLRKGLTWDAQDKSAWINTDPRGYIQVASKVGESSDFRKVVKFIKRWKDNLRIADGNLKLKSFHLEQVVTEIFQRDRSIDIFDAVFEFFCDLPDIIRTPNQIADRVNNAKYIDDYLVQFTKEQLEKITSARDGFLIKLENLTVDDNLDELLVITFYERGNAECFMFDYKIPVLTDDNSYFSIGGFLKKKSGYREYKYQISSKNGIVVKNDLIKFKVINDDTGARLHKWKVKNDPLVAYEQLRGEITNGKTRNDPEKALYSGRHYVEAYAIKDNVCVAKARQDVIL